MDASPESTTIQALREQLGDRYDRYDESEQARHAALTHAIRRPADVALDAVERGERRWTVAICAADGIGALSIIAGLFTAYRLDILNADVFTVSRPASAPEPRPERLGAARRWGGPRRPPLAEPRAPTRVLLDIFDVRPLARSRPTCGSASAPTWPRWWRCWSPARPSALATS